MELRNDGPLSILDGDILGVFPRKHENTFQQSKSTHTHTDTHTHGFLMSDILPFDTTINNQLLLGTKGLSALLDNTVNLQP